MTEEEIMEAWENPLTEEMRRENELKAEKDFPRLFEMLTGVKYKEGMDIRDYV